MAILIYDFTESSNRDKENLTSLFKSIFPGNWKMEGDFLQGVVTELDKNPERYGLDVYSDLITISSLKELAEVEDNLLSYTYLDWKITSWGYCKGKVEFELVDEKGQEANAQATFPFSLYKKTTKVCPQSTLSTPNSGVFYVLVDLAIIPEDDASRYCFKGSYSECDAYITKITTYDEYGDRTWGTPDWWENWNA